MKQAQVSTSCTVFYLISIKLLCFQILSMSVVFPAFIPFMFVFISNVFYSLLFTVSSVDITKMLSKFAFSTIQNFWMR